MALVVYPDVGYTSFISLVDADSLITLNYPLADKWSSLTDEKKEVYLRLHCNTILNKIDTLLLPVSSGCLGKSNATMAFNDVINGISITLDRNIGLVTKEKVGDVEVDYKQFRSNTKIPSIYNDEIKHCLGLYGAVFGSNQVTLGKS